MNIWRIKTKISPSKIHGNGRFSLEKIQKGSLVLIINGPIIEKKLAPNKFPITEDLVINCDDSFVNHSIDNNLDLIGQIFFIANKEIQIDEELTMDYKQFVKNGKIF